MQWNSWSMDRRQRLRFGLEPAFCRILPRAPALAVPADLDLGSAAPGDLDLGSAAGPGDRTLGSTGPGTCTLLRQEARMQAARSHLLVATTPMVLRVGQSSHATCMKSCPEARALLAPCLRAWNSGPTAPGTPRRTPLSTRAELQLGREPEARKKGPARTKSRHGVTTARNRRLGAVGSFRPPAETSLAAGHAADSRT